MAREDFADTPALSGSWSADERVTAFLRGVYGWMGAGLAVTAATAWFIANSPAAIQMVVGNRGLMWILIIAQLGIVVALSARVQQMARFFGDLKHLDGVGRAVRNALLRKRSPDDFEYFDFLYGYRGLSRASTAAS